MDPMTRTDPADDRQKLEQSTDTANCRNIFSLGKRKALERTCCKVDVDEEIWFVY